MSRIGKKSISVSDVTIIDQDQNLITCQGPKGTLNYKFSEQIEVRSNDKSISLQQVSENQKTRAIYGLTRTLINNMVVGVKDGFNKRLELQGVGYRSQLDGTSLVLNVGYSHPVRIDPPQGISLKVENNTNIVVSGIDKQIVGQVAAKIRAVRPPEPYKGKGIRYFGENVKRKVGKTGKK
uniref:ribosomal protein L6 n=1 Tax=Timspurckia oligopyrenoides TaxID=708627 RepID=UPI001FCD474A|nr:ribosomal protein L6 [Timspurckia oligopyrenoides]UNJ17556.1 ribosomal protein L6 [Timspurckia oligopyrenoides]